MKCLILILFPAFVFAQMPVINLSQKHVTKLQQLSGERRLERYLKYRKIDSAVHAKELLSQLEKQLSRTLPQGFPTTPDIDLPALQVPEVPVPDAPDAIGTLRLPEDAVPEYAIPDLNTDAISSGAIANAQKSVSKIISKYSDFANSQDLTHATRQTSLKDHRFAERLVPSMNFSVADFDPLAFTISPHLGYRITTRLQTGIGMNVVINGKTKLNHPGKMTTLAYRGFITYDVLSSYFATLEAEKRSREQRGEFVRRHGILVNLGAGKKFLVHPKFYFTVTALYNVIAEDVDPFHRQRFMVRMGVQLSPLATRVKKPSFDPNK